MKNVLPTNNSKDGMERVAHDLNNILQVISGNAQLARTDLPTDHPAQDSLQEISKATAKAFELVERIMILGLPQQHDNPVVQPAPIKTREVGQSGRRVLYIDDEKSMVFIGKRILERGGYNVTSFADAAIALREFRRRPHEFDVVVTDLAMQGVDGWAVAQEVLGLRPGLPVVITSGYVGAQEQERAQSLGVRALISKSASLEELSRLLNEIFMA